MPGPVPRSITLHPDDIDALLYDARIGDTGEVKDTMNALCIAHNADASYISAAAVDPDTGNGCFHYACANGHLEVMACLIETLTQTADLALRLEQLTRANHAGNTPLHYAAMNGQLSAVKALLKAIDAAIAADSGSQAAPGVSDAKSRFLSAKNDAGHDAAYEAESNNKEEIVTYLLGVMDEVEATTAAQSSAGAEDEAGGDEEGAANADKEFTVTIKSGTEELDDRIANVALDGDTG